MKLKTLMMGAGIAAMVAGGALAQDNSMEEPADDTMMSEPQTGMEDGMTGDMSDTTGMDGEVAQAPTFTSLDEMTVGDVVGFVAYDPEGDRIAEIDYVVEESDGAKAVIGIGGFLGLGEYTVALPLTDFELREDGMSFVLSTDKETLKEQPEFDESGVEGLPDETPIADLLLEDEAAGEDPAAAETDTENSSGADSATETDTEADADTGMAEEPEANVEAGTDSEGEAALGADTATDADAESDGSADDMEADTEMEAETETTQ
ncbi:hypothetical protein [Maritimibacter sp. UBA3975]|uniref:hypothetical protein n=1 Tax=Maritimibacter sp. UBA3975 TaxID=1946833 RepID=UPI000C09BC74|nr:hypothetical protein [Maritimibacter sp. UBA3975]MAM63497.1 hypothetical protein [Maritimibacter sp.]|tara:strand:- start:110638 stop:111426 length:789 start_codon:yes stop_codon:yes gene_type:complete